MTDLMLNENELEMMKKYFEDEPMNDDELENFLRIHSMILNVGDGDAQFENLSASDIMTSLNETELNEGVVGNVLNFMKGKSAISKYYKGLASAAKSYIQNSKKIDNVDKDKRKKLRDAALSKYEGNIKSLDDTKKKMDELKKDSTILQKFDSYANGKYKIKMFLTGRKSGVNLSKMKGYSDDLDSIKANQKKLQDDIDTAMAEVKDEKKEDTSKEEPTKDEPSKEEPSKDDNSEKAKLQKQIDGLEKDLQKYEDDSSIATDKGESEKSLKIAKQYDAASDKLKKLKKDIKNIKESTFIPLSLYYTLSSLNEEIKCLENSIDGKL